MKEDLVRIFKGLIAAAIAASLLVIPAGALAKSRDSDHDRMPNKWEIKHHLNPRVKDARKDPDKDKLSNLSEFRNHTDPQKADTDGDGIDDENEVRDNTNPTKVDSDDDGVDDADEVSGTITSFTNGVLTIQLPGDGAGTVSGTVNSATVIECDDDADDAPAPTTTAKASHDGSDDNSGPGSGDDRGDDNQGDDDNDNEGGGCTTANLKPGARVHEAKLTKATDGSMVFTKIELVPAA
jgi:hypothetical protein